MLNHSPNAQGLAYLDKKSDFYCVNAEYKCVNEGDEIFVCYGAHDNIRLWVEYGFSIPHNIFNRVDVPNGVLFALAETLGLDVSDEKKRIIEEMAIPNTMYLSDIKPSFGIQKNIAILLMDKLQLKDVKTLVYGSMQNEEAEDTIYLFLEALKGLLEKRVKTCSTAFSHFWTEQVEILNNIIKLREDSSDDE
ncbi:unnamed protein product [Bursaphelenchus okinawaensis]|uniref:SET domain-containing protein n=1 Tax=Bursaphelenchus okinawaensis TaxID=465554 RepID=A0A811JR36_9BILA|nr:unnamed protein product [Bursaphelenchus okinawaensis]CAG9079611.1 unnamed protein product [Bursaphelenchus okinawaensis]